MKQLNRLSKTGRAVLTAVSFSGLLMIYLAWTLVRTTTASKKDEFRQVVVVNRILAAGHVLEAVDLELKEWPESLLPAGYFSDAETAVGCVLNKDAAPGEILLSGKLVPCRQTKVLPVLLHRTR
jgi:Flp pilus assembly protein CpaB